MNTYLYIKKCSHCNLQYFGKTNKENVEQYKGSGMFWRRHLNKYSAKPITLEVFKFENPKEAKAFALMFSEYNCIVESKLWANLVVETTEDGGFNREKNIIIQKEKIEKGVHPFQDEEIKKRNRESIKNTNLKKLDAKTHQFIQPEFIKKNRELSRTRQLFRITQGTHQFSNSEFQSNISKKTNKLRLENGTHQTLQKKTCKYCNKIVNIPNYSRWHDKNCKKYVP